MAYISYINYENATEEVRALHDKFSDADGTVDNILRIHAPNPKSWTAHYELYATLMRGRSDLSRAQREMIAVVVSSINECHY